MSKTEDFILEISQVKEFMGMTVLDKYVGQDEHVVIPNGVNIIGIIFMCVVC